MKLLYKKSLEIGFLLLTMVSCSSPVPQQKDYIGVYNLIKIKENGTVLNLSTNGTILNIKSHPQIILTDELYISSIDRNEDNIISQDEIIATSYDFFISENNKPVLRINNNEILVELIRHNKYDLLLKRIDQLGNETIMYLKKIKI